MKREKAIRVMRTCADIWKPPFQLLEDELQGICSFSMRHRPKEFFSEDDPPLKLGERADIIPIDGFLGLYSPYSQEIIIFQKGIKEASDRLRVKPEHLEFIVRVHEWAHAIFHLGITENDRLKIQKDDSYWAVILNANTKLFEGIENDLHECLAQLLTFYCIQSLKRNSKTDQGKQVLYQVEKTFHHLSARQPPQYRIDDLLKLNVSKDRILKSIGLLRNKYLVGKVEPWKTVVTW